MGFFDKIDHSMMVSALNAPNYQMTDNYHIAQTSNNDDVTITTPMTKNIMAMIMIIILPQRAEMRMVR